MARGARTPGAWGAPSEPADRRGAPGRERVPPRGWARDRGRPRVSARDRSPALRAGKAAVRTRSPKAADPDPPGPARLPAPAPATPRPPRPSPTPAPHRRPGEGRTPPVALSPCPLPTAHASPSAEPCVRSASHEATFPASRTAARPPRGHARKPPNRRGPTGDPPPRGGRTPGRATMIRRSFPPTPRQAAGPAREARAVLCLGGPFHGGGGRAGRTRHRRRKAQIRSRILPM